MAWNQSRQEYRSRWQPRPLSETRLPGWAWQALVALMVFFFILGASRSDLEKAQDLAAMAKKAVDQDISYDDVRGWLAKLPGL